MFERYTEKARRVIFFARYESSQFGNPSIETEHLLLGLLREDKALAYRFLGSRSVESIRKHVEVHTTRREKISTSVDLPLSSESKRVLAYSAEEATQLGHEEIGTQHMLLGLLRETECFAAVLLNKLGLQFDVVRQDLATHGVASSLSPGKLLESKLVAYLESLPHPYVIVAGSSPISVKPDRSPATAPFLVIEILSPIERFSQLRRRIEEYLAAGLRYVWLFDADTRHVYIATPAGGFGEFKDGVLRTENPVLELPLTEIFA